MLEFFDANVVYWHWLVLGIVLVAAEAVVPGFVIIWFGAGAIAVGLLMLVFALGFNMQLLLWMLFSAASAAAWFLWISPRMRDRTTSGLARESIVGETGMVIKAPHTHNRGMLKFSTPKLGAEEWQFICDQPVVIGDRVSVKEISGNTLIVEKR